MTTLNRCLGDGKPPEHVPEAAVPSLRIYWHRELPPLTSEAVAEHNVEATSGRVSGMLASRDEQWEKCYEDLMLRTRARLEQEIVRLGGNSAHVLSESVDIRHDGATDESWLHGSFTYMLYRRAGTS